MTRLLFALIQTLLIMEHVGTIKAVVRKSDLQDGMAEGARSKSGSFQDASEKKSAGTCSQSLCDLRADAGGACSTDASVPAELVGPNKDLLVLVSGVLI